MQLTHKIQLDPNREQIIQLEKASGCGCINQNLKLSDRTFTCLSCNLSIDRDFNASLNLSTLGQSGINACGHLPTSSLDIMTKVSRMVETRNIKCKSGDTSLHFI